MRYNRREKRPLTKRNKSLWPISPYHRKWMPAFKTDSSRHSPRGLLHTSRPTAGNMNYLLHTLWSMVTAPDNNRSATWHSSLMELAISMQHILSIALIVSKDKIFSMYNTHVNKITAYSRYWLAHENGHLKRFFMHYIARKICIEISCLFSYIQLTICIKHVVDYSFGILEASGQANRNHFARPSWGCGVFYLDDILTGGCTRLEHDKATSGRASLYTKPDKCVS